MFKNFNYSFFYIVILLLLCLSLFYLLFNSTLANAYSYYGKTGTEVTEIQKRLSWWGYYKGPVDGIYGYGTYKGVRYFQSKNGLSVDGIAGNETLSALGINTPTASVSSNQSSSSSRNVNLLSHLVHGEARGEPYLGQVAVASVVLNRVRNSKFPQTIAGVIYQGGAFDAVSDGQINLTPNNTSVKAARDALNGWDPSQGCIYYFNPNTATSKWIWSRPIIKQIGKHYFAK